MTPEAAQALRIYGAAAMELLRNHSRDAGGIPQIPKSVVTFSGRSTHERVLPENDFHRLLDRIRAPLLASPESGDVLRAAGGNLSSDSERRARWELVAAFESCVRAANTLDLDEATFLTECSLRYPFCAEPHITITALAVVQGLRSELHEIQFENGVTLSTLTDEEKGILASGPVVRLGKRLSPGDLVGAHSKLTILKTVPVDDLNRHVGGAGRLQAEQVLTALRLSCSGNPGIDQLKLVFAPAPPAGPYSGESPTPHLSAPLHLTQCEILAADQALVTRMTTIYQRLTPRPENKSAEALTIALHRFNKSYTRTTDDDRVTDLVTSLEAALLPGERAREKRKKVVVGAKALLGNESTIAARLEWLYETRNTIVHGGTTSAAFLEEAKSIVRRVLVECLSQSRRRQQ